MLSVLSYLHLAPDLFIPSLMEGKLSRQKPDSDSVISLVIQTWMYISVPLVLYVGERTLRAFRSKAYAVKILKVTCNILKHILHIII